jgi:hypothetical protein
MPDLFDQYGSHYAWHDDLDVLEVSEQLFEALGFVDGVVSG